MLSLQFARNRADRLSLYKTEVLRSDSPDHIIAQVGAKSRHGRFKWTNAVQALCLLLVKYAEHCLRNPKAEWFDFTTKEDPNHAQTLDDRMDKERQGASSWMVQIFGPRDEEGHTPLYYLLQNRLNPGGSTAGPYGFQIPVKAFPPATLKIYASGLLLTKADALLALANEIKPQWKAIRRTKEFKEKRPPAPSEPNPPVSPVPQAPAPASTSSAPPSALEAVVSTGAGPTAPPQAEKKTASPRSEKRRKGLVQKNEEESSAIMRPRGDESLADWFRGLSMDQIQNYIVAATGSAKPKQLLKELLDPDSTMEIANKLATCDAIDYGCFYSSHHIPKALKSAVSAIIDEDLWLEVDVRDNMQKSGSYLQDLDSWFDDAAQYYSREFARGFADDLIENQNKTWLLRSLQHCDLWTMFRLIQYFHEMREKPAVRMLVELCFRNDFAVLRETVADEEQREVVLCFWNSAQEWMTREQVQKLQRFLIQEKVLH
jgi:hypothetical protein